jgi:hypothetical protein
MRKIGNFGPKSAEKNNQQTIFSSRINEIEDTNQDFPALKIKLIVQVFRSVCSMIQLSQNQLIWVMHNAAKKAEENVT